MGRFPASVGSPRAEYPSPIADGDPRSGTRGALQARVWDGARPFLCWSSNLLLLSINPRFARMILQGDKTIELHSRAPRRSTDFWLALYATTPERAVIGIVRAREVIVATPEELWVQVQNDCGVGKEEYRRYYEGTVRAVGLRLETPLSFSNPVSLEYLRNLWPGFQPPRSFAYLSDEQIEEVWEHAGLRCIHGAPT